MPSDFDIISGEASDALQVLLRRTFEAGRSLGRIEAASRLRERLMSVVDIDLSEGSEPEPELAEPEDFDELIVHSPALAAAARAAPGSVKPTILRVVTEKPGMTTAEIQSLTGIKHNSVRGTLWTLGTENAVYRNNSRWYPQAQKNEAADDQSSAAPISQPVTLSQVGVHQADPSEPGREVAHDNIE